MSIALALDMASAVMNEAILCIASSHHHELCWGHMNRVFADVTCIVFLADVTCIAFLAYVTGMLFLAQS